MPEIQETSLKPIIKEVAGHGEILEEHSLQLRIQAEQIKQLQDNSIRLENVVMTENRETRLTITNSNKQLHELINNVLGFKQGVTKMTNDLKVARLEKVSKIVGILCGSGGILYYIISSILDK